MSVDSVHNSSNTLLRVLARCSNSTTWTAGNQIERAYSPTLVMATIINHPCQLCNITHVHNTTQVHIHVRIYTVSGAQIHYQQFNTSIHYKCSQTCFSQEQLVISLYTHAFVAIVIHCKNKMVDLTNLGYLSCIFTTKQCAHKQIN